MDRELVGTKLGCQVTTEQVILPVGLNFLSKERINGYSSVHVRYGHKTGPDYRRCFHR